MVGKRAGKRLRLRFGLRSAVLLLLVIAAILTVLRPLVREPLREFERYARIKFNEPDMYRHLDEGRKIAERFAHEVSSARLDSARQLTTVSFQRRVSSSEFESSVGGSALNRGPCELTKGVIHFSDAQGRFLSEYDFLCGPREARRSLVKLTLATESGQLKIDRIEVDEVALRQP